MYHVEDEVMGYLHYLCETIGQRPAGSPQNLAAAEYIERVFKDYGYSVTRQWFDCPAWEHRETLLEVAGRRLEAQANWRSLPVDVIGRIVPVGTIEELRQADLEGCIALMHGELTVDELSPRSSTAYYPPDHKKINQLLDDKKIVAVVTVSPLLQSIRHVIKDPQMPVASASVTPQVGMELLRHAGESARLMIDATLTSGQSCNLIATRQGSGPERIVISAHYDTVWGTPGAYDNASGVSVLLTLAHILTDRDFPVELEFYVSSGEEFGGQGTIKYLAKYGLKEMAFQWDRPIGEHSKIWEPILANINTDGVGLALGANNITIVAASKAFSNMVDGIRKERYPGVIHVGPWPASDHYTFYSHGVPSIALGCTGGVSNHHHQPVDTIDWLSPEKLSEVVNLEMDILDGLADKSTEWCRESERKR